MRSLAVLAFLSLAACAAEEFVEPKAKATPLRIGAGAGPPAPAGAGKSYVPAATGPAASVSSSAGVAPPAPPDGGSRTYRECVGNWDAATHMSQQEWRTACQRTEFRVQELQREAQESVNAMRAKRDAVKR